MSFQPEVAFFTGKSNFSNFRGDIDLTFDVENPSEKNGGYQLDTFNEARLKIQIIFEKRQTS